MIIKTLVGYVKAELWIPEEFRRYVGEYTAYTRLVKGQKIPTKIQVIISQDIFKIKKLITPTVVVARFFIALLLESTELENKSDFAGHE